VNVDERSHPRESQYWITEDVGLALTAEGTLNPGIIHPQWFARHDLLHWKEADDATVEISADDYTLFRTRDFTTEVSRRSLTIATYNQAFEPQLRDLFIGTFRLLVHTPLRELSVSRFTHWRINPLVQQKEPPVAWAKFMRLTRWQEVLHSPTPVGIAVKGVTGAGVESLVSVEPSDKEGALVYVGCRYDWSLAEDSPANDLIRIIKEDWSDARQHADRAINWVLRELTP
jgi:hypothetical protein